MGSSVALKIDKYFSQYAKRTYPKGQILIFADENPKYIFYIVKGIVRKYDISYRGDEVIVNLFNKSDSFPMSWIINQTPNKYFYKTETESELRIIPTEDALQFIKDNPDVALDLLSRIYITIDDLLGRIVQLMSGSARSRLIYELVLECHGFGEKDKKDPYLLSVSEVDLAARCGLSRETVSREINKLKNDGVLSLSPRGILINDLTELEKKLHVEV